MSVLEAMSVARPVIATRVGGLTEVVAEGETGLLFSPDQPSEMAAELIGLARDGSRVDELGQAGRERQQRLFSVEAMTRGYAELLTDLDRGARDRRHEWETARR
jgi:glycosyltransferase involved in cell wall biosynthesis